MADGRKNSEEVFGTVVTKRQYGLNSFQALILALAITSGIVLLFELWDTQRIMPLLAFAGVTFTVSLIAFIRLIISPDTIRAKQTDVMLKLARQSFALIRKGLNEESAEHLCRMLISVTTAEGVAIVTPENTLGYVQRDGNKLSSALAADALIQAAQGTLESGHTVVLSSPKDIDLSTLPCMARAAIAAPVMLNRKVHGVIMFFYKNSRRVTETQRSIVDGFGALVSTEMAASALEVQQQLATDMQLKALQNQINPHFLFNTINTIASLIRTDPMKARELLREFAIFYRRTLEDSDGLILLSREAEQTYRYFQFEVARFGEDRVELLMNEQEGVEDMLVPPFLLQPLVENSVRHAMPAEGKLTVRVDASIDKESGNLIIRVVDNGVGMTKEACDNIMHPESSTGCGIAVKNVHDRIKGYFGPDSRMEVESTLGVGTTVTLTLVCKPEENEE